MRNIKINKKTFKTLGILFFALFGMAINSNVAFAGGILDGSGSSGFKLPEGCVSVSDYEGGYYSVQNQFSRAIGGDSSSDTIYYFKAANIEERVLHSSLKNPKNVYTVYLYALTNDKFDEEIEGVMKKRKKLIDAGEYSELKTIPGYFDGVSMSFFPDGEVKYTFENMMMWPVSSGGDYYIKDLYSASAKTKIANHNINDFSQVSKPDNFWLGSLISDNNKNYGETYLKAGYDLSVKYPSSSEVKNLLDKISNKFYGKSGKFAESNYFNAAYAVSKSSKKYNGSFKSHLMI
ncbi:MAG TPA: hypothetical protein GXZ90_08335 [Clostridiales bacterium]|nr:hypothetical protein [Clostridiales bacterium]